MISILDKAEETRFLTNVPKTSVQIKQFLL